VTVTVENTITHSVQNRTYWFEPKHVDPQPDLGYLAKDFESLWLRLRAKVKGIHWNAAVFLAESGKMTQMLTSNAKKFAAAGLHLKRGNVVKAVRALGGDARNAKVPRKFTSKDAANRWLEGQYGWRPLVQDVQSAAEFAASMLFSQRVVLRKRAQTAGSLVVLDPMDYIPLNEYQVPFHRVYMRRRTTYTVQRRVGCVVEKRHSDVPDSLGFTSPALVIWEIVPFSFVIDWFINISQWLEGAGALMGVDVTDLWSSTLLVKSTDCWFEVVPEGVNPDNRWKVTVTHHNRYESDPSGLGSEHFVERNYNRSGHGTGEIPMPLPQISRDPLGFARCVSSLALIKQRARNGR
jgi:hypothetical protein